MISSRASRSMPFNGSSRRYTFAFLDSDIDSGVIDKLNYLSDFMLENGYISKAIDVDSFVDTSYYEKLKTSEQ